MPEVKIRCTNQQSNTKTHYSQHAANECCGSKASNSNTTSAIKDILKLVQNEQSQIPDEEKAHMKWIAASDLGPRQAKAIKQAIGKLRAENNTFGRRTGVIGTDNDHTSYLYAPLGGAPTTRTDVQDAEWEIYKKYNKTITPKNYKDIIEDMTEALNELKQNRPVVDERITKEEDEENRQKIALRDMEYKKIQDQRQQMRDELLKLAPSGAHSVVVAELTKDASDPMTDYFASHTEKTVAIGFRYGQREDFKQLQECAKGFLSEEDYAKITEHRDNYSMGRGNYLSDHGWGGSGSGWIIRSYPLDGKYWNIDEIDLSGFKPRNTAAPVSSGEGKPANFNAKIQPSSTGKPGYIELHFPSKPEPQVLESLKGAGYRYSKWNKCWYGQETKLPKEFIS